MGGMFMKARIVIPFVLCIVMSLGSAGIVWNDAAAKSGSIFFIADSPYEQLYRLEETAAALYEAAFVNNRQAAYAQLQKLNRYLDKDMLYAYGQEEGWAAIRKDIAVIEDALAKGVAGSGWIYNTARIKLAVDAVIRPNAALWLQYESLLLDDMMRVKQASKRQAGNAANAALAMMNSLQEHARRIEPAAAMAVDPIRADELMERIVYSSKLLEAKRDSGRINGANIDQSFVGLELAIKRLFQEGNGALAVPAIAVPATSHPMSWALFIGTIICAVLTYTGWRKYKREPYGIKPLS